MKERIIHNITVAFCFLKYILFELLSFFIIKNKEDNTQKILLIKRDRIGDYVLFHNFIEELKKNRKFKDHKIILCGNIVWKELAVYFDQNFVDKFIWIDNNKFRLNFIYIYRKTKQLAAYSYDLVINPTYSRSYFYDDFIVKNVHAHKKIGSIGDCSATEKWFKSIADKYYTKLAPAQEGILFEFYRNKEFFQFLLEEEIDIKRPFFIFKDASLKFDLPDNYVVFFIGASDAYRKWPTENFAQLANYIYKEYDLNIILCGGHEDEKAASEFKNLCELNIYDLVGKTTLFELLKVINSAQLLVSNETSAPHFAIACDIKVVVIYNGNHFGRFTPYPSEITEKYHVIYHPEIEKDIEAYKLVSNNPDNNISTLNIADIKVESVIQKVNQALHNL